jgi:Domain of Unknown Function (DUF928)
MKWISILVSLTWLLTNPLLTILILPTLSTTSVWAQGRPKNRRPAGRKGVCPSEQSLMALTAVVPATGDDLSLSPTPTFLFLIPDAPQPNLKATFRLQANRRNIMPPIAVPLAHTPGIVRVRLPQPIVTEKPFQWSLQVTCGAEKSFEVTGTVVSKVGRADLVKQLGQAKTGRDRVALYQKAGFWLDAVATLAEVQAQDPTAQKDWQNLLQTLNLPELQQQPVVACCTLP